MCHVLIIEDEALVAMELQLLLEDVGATSFAFADDEEGAIAAAMICRPDLITSDVKLSHGTGPSAISTIQSRLGNIPVIFITGTPSECHPCQPPGIVLEKPVSAHAIKEAFTRLRA